MRSTARRRRPETLALLAALAGLGAGCAYETIDQHPCPPGGTTLTYANFGKHFIDGYCQACHGSASTARGGAPGDYIFDTLDQIQRHRDRIYVRAAASNDSMPPGPDDPPREARDRLAEWLACGAPP
jgi:uncharacterized membrane protein